MFVELQKYSNIHYSAFTKCLFNQLKFSWGKVTGLFSWVKQIRKYLYKNNFLSQNCNEWDIGNFPFDDVENLNQLFPIRKNKNEFKN